MLRRHARHVWIRELRLVGAPEAEEGMWDAGGKRACLKAPRAHLGVIPSGTTKGDQHVNGGHGNREGAALGAQNSV